MAEKWNKIEEELVHFTHYCILHDIKEEIINYKGTLGSLKWFECHLWDKPYDFIVALKDILERWIKQMEGK